MDLLGIITRVGYYYEGGNDQERSLLVRMTATPLSNLPYSLVSVANVNTDFRSPPSAPSSSSLLSRSKSTYPGGHLNSRVQICRFPCNQHTKISYCHDSFRP